MLKRFHSICKSDCLIIGQNQREVKMAIAQSILLFVLAGLCEIGGGYLVWIWLREGRSHWIGLIGGLVLMLYGVIPTLQPEHNFGRIYAAYGGIFVIMSLL